MRTGLVWQMAVVVTVALIATTVFTVLFASSRLSAFYLEQTEHSLLATTRWTAEKVSASGSAGNPVALQNLIDDLTRNLDLRITIVDANGEVVADNLAAPALMDNHRSRPEIIEAFRSGTGMSVRHSDTLDQQRVYSAVRLDNAGEERIVVRTSIALDTSAQTMGDAYRSIALSAAIVLIVALAFCIVFVRRVARGLRAIQTGAQQLTDGDTTFRLRAGPAPEFSDLATVINTMADALRDRVASAEARRNELEAVLRSMVEGVVAIDAESRILNLNRAAAAFFDIDPQRAVGQSIEAAVRNAELQAFARKTLASDEPSEGEIIVYDEGIQYLQAHGTALRNAAGKRIGVVIVLNDVTRLRRLEEARSEFVANVSHELRTPITAIKGYTETLIDGALDDRETTKRFLNTIARQSNRLNQLIEDLLALSTIERTQEAQLLDRVTVNLDHVVESAVSTCAAREAETGARIHLELQEDIRVYANAALLQQAISNLIDNALKYSSKDGEIAIRTQTVGAQAEIAVQDHGAGIAAEHLDRIFERFYRVDKARSRALGGTGLGLAIVKHIALAHGGEVDVASEMGKGSTFYIRVGLTSAENSKNSAVAG